MDRHELMDSVVNIRHLAMQGIKARVNRDVLDHEIEFVRLVNNWTDRINEECNKILDRV
jgi:hypothetical protein